MIKRLWFCNLNNGKCSEKCDSRKQQRIIKIAINKVLKREHECTKV